MKFAGSRKLAWIICGVGSLLAAAGICFLPESIPVHFYDGLANDYGNKIEIFLFPILLVLITFLTGREKIKYYLTHAKTLLTDMQYYLMINGVLGIILLVEIYVMYASFV